MRQSDRVDDLEGPGVVVATGVAYYALAQLMWQIDTQWGSAFWPAAGLTFAVLCRTRRSWWVPVLLVVAAAEGIANLQNDMTLRTSVLGAVANVIEPAIGATLFRRAVPSGRVSDLGALGRFVVCGALAGPAVGALVGGPLVVGGPNPPVERWLRWFVGDAVGVIAVAPVLLSMWRPGQRFLRRRGAELAAATAATVVVCVALIVPEGTASAVTPYLAVPLGLWAALRFGVAGAACASSLLAAVVHGATATGHGPFVTAGEANLVVAQVFVGAVALSALTVAVLNDAMRSQREREQALLHRALHDPLTGVANRAMLADRIEQEAPAGLLVIDLDGFKSVNDTYGHAVGDVVLCAVADRLTEVSRADDLVVRLGGDEFVVVLFGSPDIDAVDEVRERLTTALSEPVHVGGLEVPIRASIGSVVATPSSTPSELLAEADRVMYERKRSIDQTVARLE